MKSFLAVLLVALAPGLRADEYDPPYYYQVANGQATITGVADTYEGPVIASSLGGYLVTAIGDGAFTNCYTLSRITIPSSIANIGSHAFYNCPNLTNVTINGASLTNIGAYAFGGCRSLPAMSIPGSVVSIAPYAFYKCVGLSGIVIPEHVMTLGEGAFSGCSGLSAVTLPAGLDRIGDGLFKECTGLAGVMLPDGVTNLGFAAFQKCSRLAQIRLPESVRRVEAYAFEGCVALTNAELGGGVAALGDWVFSGCLALPRVTIPGSLVTVGAEAFSGCTSLTNITIPDTVSALGASAFSGCTRLSGFQIPTGLTHIASSTFRGCSRLSGVTIPPGVREIGPSAFWGCSSLTGVSIPGGEVGDFAFKDCSALSVVELAEGVVTLGSSAFQGCRSLARVVMPGSLTTLGEAAFYGCSGLTNVVVGGAVTRLDNRVFYGCALLRDVVIPTAVTRIGEEAFLGCTGLTNVTIGGGVAAIGNLAFQGCGGLARVTIPASVSTLGQYLFYGCSGLTRLYFEGDAPALTGGPYIADAPGAACYCIPLAAGWPATPATFGNLPLYLWVGPHTLTVSSPYGEARPGTWTTDVASPFTESVLGSPVLNGATQYVCQGGSVAGNDASWAGSTSVTFRLTNDAALTWSWSTNYWLRVVTNGSGSVSTPAGWQAAGSPVALVALATTNTRFIAWQGDTNGCVAAGATLLAPMDQARSISAVFVVTTNRTLTVVSAHGGALPGTTVTQYGTMLSLSITNSPLVVGATQYVCTGATVAGVGFTPVSPTNVTVVLTHHATLTWNWSTNYLLRVATNGLGSASLPESWQAKGSSVLVVARSGAHARFGSWSGEIKGCKIKTNTITAVMTAPRAITANFIGQGRVTVAAAPADGGTVTGGGTADTNKTLKLRAKPLANWRFAGWADGTNFPASRTVVVAQGGVTYTALFAMVTGELVLSTNRLEFGAVTVGQVVTQQVVVTNRGPNSVTVKSMKLPGGCTATPKSFILASSGVQTVKFVYKPAKAGLLSGAVLFRSNAARGLAAGSLTLSGTAAAVAPALRSLAARPAGGAVAGEEAALLVRVLELAPAANPSDAPEEDLAAVVFAGGKLQVAPGESGGGMFTLESRGADRDEDGLPDALAAPLGDLLKQEGVLLLSIRRVDGTLTATTPFVEWFELIGAPVPQTELPAEWRLGQKNK